MSDQRYELALVDRQIDVAERSERALARLESHRDVLDAKVVLLPVCHDRAHHS
jgi:hypothetical protein